MSWFRAAAVVGGWPLRQGGAGVLGGLWLIDG